MKFAVSMGGQRRLYYCCCRDRRWYATFFLMRDYITLTTGVHCIIFFSYITDTQDVKRKTPKTTRMFDGKLTRKIFMVVVGASFCVFVAFVLPKLHASPLVVEPEHLSRIMKDIYFRVIFSCPLTQQQIGRAHV